MLKYQIFGVSCFFGAERGTRLLRAQPRVVYCVGSPAFTKFAIPENLSSHKVAPFTSLRVPVFVYLMRREGLEPSQAYAQQPLKLSRIPIPPSPHIET